MGRFNRFMVAATCAVLATSFVACGSDVDGGAGGSDAAGGSGGFGGSGGSGAGGGGGGEDEFADCEGRPGGSVVVDRNITVDTTWCAKESLLLEDYIFVTNGATLRIQAGTEIRGTIDTALTITRGAKIEASGTADAPIVFTSVEPVGQRQPADWGGLVILGRAPILVDGDPNTVDENNIEGFADTLGDLIRYGGDDADDNSGTLRYVRIEWAGETVGQDDELNGLTLGGVGRGTTLEHIQVHGGSDDGIEFFGGTVNAKYLVVTDVEDDSIDWDLGYSGKIQFVVIRQGPAGDNGYEASSNKSNPDGLPRAIPEIWNVTMIGGGDSATKTQRASTFKEGTGGHFGNHIVMNFGDFIFDVSGTQSAAIWGTDLTVRNTLFWGNGTKAAADQQDGDFDELAKLQEIATVHFDLDPMLGNTAGTNPNFAPQQGSPALTNGAAPPSDGFFDSTATFVGAMGTTDWTAGWTSFAAN